LRAPRILVIVLVLTSLPPCVVLAKRLTMMVQDARNSEFIARVDNVVISKADLKAHKALAERVADNNLIGVGETRGDVFGDLLDFQLGVELCRDAGMNDSSATADELDRMEESMGLDSLDDLKSAAEKDGHSFQEVQDIAWRRAVIRNMTELATLLVNVDKSDEEKYFRDHSEDFQEPEQFRLGEIIVRAKHGDNLALAKALAIHRQLKNGAKFESFARQSRYSQAPLQNGDLGWFRHGQLAKELEEKVVRLHPGQFSGVIATKEGFVILKLIEHRPATTHVFSEAEPDVRTAVWIEKLPEAFDAILWGSAEKSFVEVNRAYVYKRLQRNTDPAINVAAAIATLIACAFLVTGINVVLSR
jgi:peptidyl-prolyl cis-trans isomerase SurA